MANKKVDFASLAVKIRAARQSVIRQMTIDDPGCEVSKEFLEREEIWKAVPGFEQYEVSTHGRLRKYIRGTLLDWYPEVTLSDGPERKKKIRVHQLVMQTFLGPPPAGCNINHEDGNKGNPRLDNLEYVPFSGNTQHAIQTGLWKPNCKLTDQQVEQIHALSILVPQREIGEMMGVSPSQVSAIIRGKRRTKKWEV